LSLGITLLAEKVETVEQLNVAKGLGFSLFQGYFFAKPTTLTKSHNPGNTNVLLRMIAKLNDPKAEVTEIAQLIELDPNLSFKVLRVVNAAATHVR
jgi:EAL and modified HD-GYP domain-containing signal transduction protein